MNHHKCLFKEIRGIHDNIIYLDREAADYGVAEPNWPTREGGAKFFVVCFTTFLSNKMNEKPM